MSPDQQRIKIAEALPKLPPQQIVHTVMPDDYRYGPVYAYTAKQMRQYAINCLDLVLSEVSSKTNTENDVNCHSSPTPGSTLGDVLPEEIKRNRELLEQYKEIGVAGGFGAAMIEEDIDRAVNALASGDVVRMLKAYEAMKNNS